LSQAFRPDDQLRRELLQLFASESRDELDAISGGLVALESDTEAAIAAGMVDQMMRAAHSLKGGARAVELDSVDRLSHSLEDLLRAAGDQRRFDGDTVDLAYRSLDGIEAIIDGASGGTPAEVEVSGLVDELHSAALALSGEEVEAVGEGNSTGAPPPPEAITGATKPAGPVPAPSDSPEATVRVRVSKLDGLMAAVRELEAARVGVEHATGVLTANAEAEDLRTREYDSRAGAIREATLAPLNRLERAAREVAGEVSEARTVPLSLAFDPLPRAVRELARELGREVELNASGGEVDVDRAVMEVLRPALVHVIRNAVDHGIESPAGRTAAGKDERGVITVFARTASGVLEVEVADDGAGIDAATVRRSAVAKGLLSPEEAAALSYDDTIELVTRPGFSTREKVTEISGRGVGLDAVNEGLGSIQGSLSLSSVPGSGTKFLMTVPLTIAATEVIVAELGGHAIGIPLTESSRVTALDDPDTASVEFDGVTVPTCSPKTLDRLAPGGRGPASVAIAVESGGRRIALPVDRLRSVLRLSTMPLPHPLPRVDLIRAAAILPDGDVLRVIEIRTLIEDLPPPPKVLVADDSAAWRERARRYLASHGWKVDTAGDGRTALAMLEEGSFDSLLTDVEMPGHDGIELTRLVRENPDLDGMRVVVWSASAGEEAGPAALSAGADRFMTKEPGAEADAATAIQPVTGPTADDPAGP
jgi:chemotaxis protein histidine kinase CheA/CheY-like chemotaxis protein